MKSDTTLTVIPYNLFCGRGLARAAGARDTHDLDLAAVANALNRTREYAIKLRVTLAHKLGAYSHIPRLIILIH